MALVFEEHFSVVLIVWPHSRGDMRSRWKRSKNKLVAYIARHEGDEKLGGNTAQTSREWGIDFIVAKTMDKYHMSLLSMPQL